MQGCLLAEPDVWVAFSDLFFTLVGYQEISTFTPNIHVHSRLTSLQIVYNTALLGTKKCPVCLYMRDWISSQERIYKPLVFHGESGAGEIWWAVHVISNDSASLSDSLNLLVVLIRDLKIGRRRRQWELHKSNRFNNQNNNLHVHHAFLYISLPSLHDYDVKMPNFTLYRGSTQATTRFPLSFCAWLWFLGIQL